MSGSARLLRIRIIAVGKNKNRWVDEGCAHFEKLLSRFADISWRIVLPPKEAPFLTPAEIRKKEGQLLQKEFAKGVHVALADKGRKTDTPAFAKTIETFQVTGRGTVNFIIGGPHGLDDAVLDKADYVLSLSSLTFSHQLVRLILLEQLYRAFSILHGTDYHK